MGEEGEGKKKKGRGESERSNRGIEVDKEERKDTKESDGYDYILSIVYVLIH